MGILMEFPIPTFPFDNVEVLQKKNDDDFRSKSFSIILLTDICFKFRNVVLAKDRVSTILLSITVTRDFML